MSKVLKLQKLVEKNSKNSNAASGYMGTTAP